MQAASRKTTGQGGRRASRRTRRRSGQAGPRPKPARWDTWIPNDDPEATGVLEYQGIRIDRLGHRVFFENREVLLTMGEFRLLECLVRHPGEALSRPQLIAAALAREKINYLRTVDQHIMELRRKLGAPGLIETVRKTGYRIREDQKGTAAAPT